MSGVAGIFLLEDFPDADSLVHHMSRRLRHRGLESIHEYVDQSNPMKKAIVAVRSHKTESPKIASDQVRLRIIDSLFPFEENSRTNKLDYENTYSTLLVQIDSIGMHIFRSVDGTCGLYYARVKGGIVFASERKSIWRITQNQIRIAEPGQRLLFAWSGDLETTQSTSFSSPESAKAISRNTAVKNLSMALVDSFRNLQGIKKCGVLFSGGVDSSLAVFLAKRVCNDTLPITAQCKNSHDEGAARKAADALLVKHVTVDIDDATLWESLPGVIYSIETSDRMQIEIAIPFFLAAQEAKRRGYSFLVSGQGPDELFAGYARYEALMRQKGPEAVNDALVRDVSVTHESNLQRDVRAVAFHETSLFFPYLYPVFVRTAMALPAQLKIDFERQPARKSIFRDVAMSFGLPEEIALSPKRATQYSSGTSRLLQNTIMDRLERPKKLSKKSTNVAVQNALNTIAFRLGIPTTVRGEVTEIDLEPTERLLTKLEDSAPSN